MVIVIGATGFIGLYTVEKLLEAGYEVLATGRNKKMQKYLEDVGVRTLELNIQDKEDFKKLPTDNVEAVILLAGLLPANAKVDISKDENADEYILVNTIGTINVLEYCRINGIHKMVGCSSYADVFNAWEKGRPLKESEPRTYKLSGDHAAYVISKNAANDVIFYYNNQHGLQGSVFRLPPVYGVGPHASIYVDGRLYKSGIQTFIENAMSGKDIEIWGDPHIARDIIYVKDVATAFVKAIQSENAIGLYNMTSGTELDLEEQVKAVIEVFGDEKNSKIIYKPEKKNNTPSFLFDMSKAKRDFGFIPEFTSYKKMMVDYKRELESGRWDNFIDSRKKD